MRALLRHVVAGALLAGCWIPAAVAQKAYTWQEVRDKFEVANPTLHAGLIGIDESRAAEITAFLRPNPTASVTVDQINPFPGGPPHSTFGSLLTVGSASYLHERQHKRELRKESAEDATKITVSGQSDLERNLIFNLRMAFIQTLQEKEVFDLAKENLSYYDHLLDVNRERYKAGAIAQVDLDRLELQRVQYESDLQTADVNLRTAKIQLLALLNDRTPVEQFDVTGTFEFNDQVMPLEEFRRVALETRPDLKAAIQSIDKAETDHRLAMANGSTDPTFSAWLTHNPSFNNPFDNNTLGASVSIPLRIFDHNQGEKLRTERDIARNQKLRDSNESQVYSDVDSAYATLNGNLNLLRPYKARYIQQAVQVRETISFAYQNGGASLLDFLQAQQEYRTTQLNYLNLIGAYLTAASQLNLAVGREVIQ